MNVSAHDGIKAARGVLATSDRRTTAALVVAAVVAVLAYVLPFPLVPRAIVELSFLLVCPGLALVRLLKIPSRPAVVTLAVVLSLVLGQVTAMVLMYGGFWNPGTALGILASLTVLLALAPHPAPRHLRAET